MKFVKGCIPWNKGKHKYPEKGHKLYFFECINCRKLVSFRLCQLKSTQLDYCKGCRLAPIIQFYICDDCGEPIQADNWTLDNKKTPYCGTCSSKRIARNIPRNIDGTKISEGWQNKMISKNSLYYGLWNLGYSDYEANEIIGDRGFTYWRIKCNLNPNFKGNLEFRNSDGTWKLQTIKGARDIQIQTRDKLKQWKFNILKKDNFQCQICNGSKKLEVHHNIEKFYDIVKKFLPIKNIEKEMNWNEKKELADKIVDYHYKNSVSGITLCNRCHKWVHMLP